MRPAMISFARMLPGRAVETEVQCCTGCGACTQSAGPGHAGRFLGRDTKVALDCVECVAKLQKAFVDVSPRERRLNSAAPAPAACLGGALVRI